MVVNYQAPLIGLGHFLDAAWLFSVWGAVHRYLLQCHRIGDGPR